MLQFETISYCISNIYNYVYICIYMYSVYTVQKLIFATCFVNTCSSLDVMFKSNYLFCFCLTDHFQAINTSFYVLMFLCCFVVCVCSNTTQSSCTRLCLMSSLCLFGERPFLKFSSFLFSRRLILFLSVFYFLLFFFCSKHQPNLNDTMHKQVG